MQLDEAFVKRRALALCDEAQTAHFRQDFDGAVVLYTRSLALYPTAEAFTGRGWVHGALGRLDEAIADCERAIATDPAVGDPYNDLGAYLIEKGLLDEAVPWLERATQAPRYHARHVPHINLGRIFAEKGDVARAIQEYEAALVHSPLDPVCRAALTELRERLH